MFSQGKTEVHGHNVDLLFELMEELNYSSTENNTHKSNQCWIEITNEYNKRLGTNFTFKQVQNKRRNCLRKFQNEAKLLPSNDPLKISS